MLVEVDDLGEVDDAPSFDVLLLIKNLGRPVLVETLHNVFGVNLVERWLKPNGLFHFVNHTDLGHVFNVLVLINLDDVAIGVL